MDVNLRRDALVPTWPKVLEASLPPNPLHPNLLNLHTMDRRTPYSLSVLAPSTDGPDESKTIVQARLRQFVLEFQLDNAFVYR